MRAALGCLLLVGACAFPTRSSQYACETTADCDSGRTCEDGFCIKAEDDGDTGVDAAIMVDGPNVDGPPDTNPLPMQCEAAGYLYVAGPSGYYRRITNTMSWTNAQDACQSHVPGATHLIVLSTAQEAAYMATQVGWIGLHDKTTEGTYATVTNETGDQRPWGAGEPDGDGDCVRMDADALVYVTACDNGRAFVCECDGRPSTF